MLAKAFNAAIWFALGGVTILLRASSGREFVLLGLCAIFILAATCIWNTPLAVKLFNHFAAFIKENTGVAVGLLVLTALFVTSVIAVAAFPQIRDFVMSKLEAKEPPEPAIQFAMAHAEPSPAPVVAPARADLAIEIIAPTFFAESAIVFAEELRTRTLIRVAQVALKDGRVTFPSLELGRHRITAVFRLSSGEIFTDSTVSNNDGNPDLKRWRALPEKRKGEIFNLDGYLIGRTLIPKQHEKILSERFRKGLPANYCILVFGFSDDIGPDWVHDEIGLLRANKVEDLLVEYHARQELLYSMTIGNRKPARAGHPNGTHQNRRVVVIIMPNIFHPGNAVKLVQASQRRLPRSEEPFEMRARHEARNRQDLSFRRRRKGRVLCGLEASIE